ncbi:MAG TPA: hypothetical protein VGX92_16055, partial [Pyrinomonadaceae bacterium]|nr:hypothetical protein [Pyrinomonadaceae bacterium]
MMSESEKERKLMRHIGFLLLIIMVALSGCGSTGNQTPAGNANQANTVNAGNTSPLNQGSGPQ